MSSSFASAATSIIFSRPTAQASTKASGMGPAVNVHPDRLRPSKSLAHRSDRSRRRKFSSAPMGNCTATGVAPRRFSICSKTRRKSGARAVHLVDETDARYFVLVGLPPHRFRLGLHPRSGAEHHHRAVKNAQERSTSMVKSTCPGVSMILMRCSSNCWSIPDQKQVVAADGNRDTALLLLLHPVHDRRAFMHLTNLVGETPV